MGYFSFTKADIFNTKTANIAFGSSFKLLIPKEFGGGFIKGRDYDCYGNITDKDGNTYDLYELLAIWNADTSELNGKKIREYLEGWDGVSPLKLEDEHTTHNRYFGIQIGCYYEDIQKLKYPLKLVSCSYKGTYESPTTQPSYNDPTQGCTRGFTWDDYSKYLARISKKDKPEV